MVDYKHLADPHSPTDFLTHLVQELNWPEIRPTRSSSPARKPFWMSQFRQIA